MFYIFRQVGLCPSLQVVPLTVEPTSAPAHLVPEVPSVRPSRAPRLLPVRNESLENGILRADVVNN